MRADADRNASVRLHRVRAMNASLARNWWLVGLRGVVALLFGVSVLAMPRSLAASLVLLFAAYVAADGACAILAGTRAARRGARWPALIVEGLVNLAAAGGVLVWQAIAVVPLVRAASAWAMVTGALLLAAARRLSGPHVRRLLVGAGLVSSAWGVLAAIAPDAADAPWLAAYALLFGAVLLGVAARLMRQHRDDEAVAGVR